MVTELICSPARDIIGFWYAPLTSSLDADKVRLCSFIRGSLTSVLTQCEGDLWLPVDWANARIAVPFNTHPDALPLRLPLRKKNTLNAWPSHVWIQDHGEYISMSDWRAAVEAGFARCLDGDLKLGTIAEYNRCRAAFRKLGMFHLQRSSHYLTLF